MSAIIEKLNAIAAATNNDERKSAVAAAKAELEHLTGEESWQDYEQYGHWVQALPTLIKRDHEKAKKQIATLIKVVAGKHKIFTEDSPEALLLAIKRCKSIEELSALELTEMSHHPLKHQVDEAKKSLYHFTVSLETRIEHLANKGRLQDGGQSLRVALANQKKYLNAKRAADKWAWPLTIAFCMLGVGVVCGVAMFAAWPVMGIAGFLAASAVIGYVEVPVFYSFIKRSLRNIFARGVFQAIDNNLLQQLAKEEGRLDRHEFSDMERDRRLNAGATWWWRRLKYALTSVGGLLTLASTIGFAALAYTQLLEVLPLLGITAGFGLVAVPAFFAVISIPYFFVMFDNVFRAIKNNIFRQIWEQIKAVYVMEGWSNALGKDKFIHLLKCLGKSFAVALTLAIVVIATVFSAGAWLQGSVEFFAGTLGVTMGIAEKIGMVVGSIQLSTNLGFNLENCFKTIGRLPDVISNGGRAVVDYFSNLRRRVSEESFIPKKIGIVVWGLLRPIVKFFPLMLHVAGVGMLSAQGTEAFVLKPFLGGSESLSVATAATTQAICEALEDAHTLMHDHVHESDAHDHHNHAHQHVHKGCDSHEHADPAADVEWLTGKVVEGGARAVTFFKRMGKPEEIAAPLPEHIMVAVKA